MRFIKKRRKSWSFVLLVVTLVMLAWVAVPLVQGATITVTSTADAVDASPGDGVCQTATPGECTLRAAIMEANALVGADTINFSIGSGAVTIQPNSELPAITEAVIIDGTSQPGWAGVPIIELDGTSAGTWGNGLVISANDSTIKGLVINSFDGHGISIDGDGNTVQGCYIGTEPDGVTAAGNGANGVDIANGSSNNTIGGATAGERNIISGNLWAGIEVRGTSGNTVSGNYIGTDASGTAALPNAHQGVSIEGGASDNRIGGTTTGERNVISGNGLIGVRIADSGTTGNVVSGNHIGTDANGTAALPNGEDGVSIRAGASNNRIGGTTAGERNIISGNLWSGIALDGSGTSGNVVSGNYIGTDANGTAALPNGGDGVLIGDGASNNTIGGTTAAERNVMSGNLLVGVGLYGSEVSGNKVVGNFIGTDANGTAALPNGHEGIVIGGGASNNTIGGTTAGEGNVISGNGATGTTLVDSGTSGNVVIGNIIGTDVGGTAALPNANEGVWIGAGASNNTIGGAASGDGNVIAHNPEDGVMVDGSDSTGNTISRNSIHSNGEQGIDNVNGGNTELTPPTIASTSCNSVSGTAPPNSTVEIFSDPEDEGKRYEGTTTADATGAFTWIGSITGPNVTATATDSAGNTSEFSMPFLGACYRIYLPLVTKNHQ